ncbi:hypothetical protein TSAR_007931 [Trichomalopsis sarcophagae]|uniref:Uncharacterized protein n=1 Tax=Trichomalopsis sarcophagae TaxID=543379 RepID=A0A232F0R9_9HYME|nr:hypothetical protein TSAR_007931 [Trichomalopsis sarcophagae]
MAVVAVSL